MKKRILEIAVKVVVAALTAFLTAITTTSCMGCGPIALSGALRITRIPPQGVRRDSFFLLNHNLFTVVDIHALAGCLDRNSTHRVPFTVLAQWGCGHVLNGSCRLLECHSNGY